MLLENKDTTNKTLCLLINYKFSQHLHNATSGTVILITIEVFLLQQTVVIIFIKYITFLSGENRHNKYCDYRTSDL